MLRIVVDMIVVVGDADVRPHVVLQPLPGRDLVLQQPRHFAVLLAQKHDLIANAVDGVDDAPAKIRQNSATSIKDSRLIKSFAQNQTNIFVSMPRCQ